MVDID
ncbi:uncharacterized protein FFC1_15911 [Fusarium fujikuroi]